MLQFIDGTDSVQSYVVIGETDSFRIGLKHEFKLKKKVENGAAWTILFIVRVVQKEESADDFLDKIKKELPKFPVNNFNGKRVSMYWHGVMLWGSQGLLDVQDVFISRQEEKVKEGFHAMGMPFDKEIFRAYERQLLEKDEQFQGLRKEWKDKVNKNSSLAKQEVNKLLGNWMKGDNDKK